MTRTIEILSFHREEWISHENMFGAPLTLSDFYGCHKKTYFTKGNPFLSVVLLFFFLLCTLPFFDPSASLNHLRKHGQSSVHTEQSVRLSPSEFFPRGKTNKGFIFLLSYFSRFCSFIFFRFLLENQIFFIDLYENIAVSPKYIKIYTHIHRPVKAGTTWLCLSWNNDFAWSNVLRRSRIDSTFPIFPFHQFPIPSNTSHIFIIQFY